MPLGELYAASIQLVQDTFGADCALPTVACYSTANFQLDRLVYMSFYFSNKQAIFCLAGLFPEISGSGPEFAHASCDVPVQLCDGWDCTMYQRPSTACSPNW